MAAPLTRAGTSTTTALAALLLLTACGGGTGPAAGEPTSSTSSSTSSGPSASEAPSSSSTSPSSASSPGTTGGAGPEEVTGDEPPFGEDPTAVVDALGRASGGPLSVVAVRTAAHEGFERVVLELGGTTTGEPGWLVRYVDEPTQDGSGDPVPVAGEAFLQVVVTPTGYPEDTGAQELVGTTPGQGTAQVTEVVTGGVFEGQTLAHIGLAGQVPFRVFGLSDPARVVVDVATS